MKLMQLIGAGELRPDLERDLAGKQYAIGGAFKKRELWGRIATTFVCDATLCSPTD